MTHKDFALLPEPTEPANVEPITFSLGPRTFTALYPLPIATSLAVTTTAIARHVVPGLVRDMLVPGDETAFDEAMADKANPVGFDVIEEVFWYLIDAYADRMGAPLTVPSAELAALMGDAQAATMTPDAPAEAPPVEVAVDA